MNRTSAITSIASPLGRLELEADAVHLLSVRIAPAGSRPRGEGDTNHPILSEARAQLLRWFSGTQHAFDLPLRPLGSPEGARLRAAINAIPYGETRTYGSLGNECGSAARAVGQACKTNAYPIIIPCHRVTSATGPEFYSGGDGPRTKTCLLDFEYANLPESKRTRLL
jgi:methylated-DNA-[protein]-cysteine S-methyltransferase